MKRKTLGYCAWLLLAISLFSAAPWQNAWAAPAYRIRYKNCTVTTNPARVLLVTDAVGATSNIKIQYLKNAPASITFDEFGNSTNAPAGTLYMAAPLTIPAIEVAGALGTFYTEAKVGYLMAPNGITTITAKKTWIDVIASQAPIRTIRMDTIVDSFGSGYATTTIQIMTPAPAPTPLSISLSGIVLERLYCMTPISTLSVASKKGKVASASVVSMGGIGRITPAALADPGATYDALMHSLASLKLTAAHMEPDHLTCVHDLGKMQALLVAFNHVKTGGIIGRSELAMGTYPPIIVYASTIGSIYAQSIVNGTFVAGVSASPSTPAYHEGTIQKIATKPNGGHLRGTAHVAPGTSASIKFTPQDHPEFLLCEDAGSHTQP